MQKLVAGADGREGVREEERVPSSPVKFPDSVLRSRAGIEFQTAVARKVFFWTEHELEKC